jgi:gluconate 2-dehydrogenase gamma chain
MSNEKRISRRTALKVIAAGVGGATTVLGQHTHQDLLKGQINDGSRKTPRFFNDEEMALIAVISELIIPADEHSPGAAAAGVNEFIDLMVSQSSDEVKTLWREGLTAIDKMCQKKFSLPFIRSQTEQQISVLKAVSRNEYRPRTIEERFFVAIKSLTVDRYYTSQIGIHRDLRYKGNAYLKDFVGCTHPEHSS